MARLLSGRVVSENSYHLAARASPSPKDPRYIDRMAPALDITPAMNGMPQPIVDRPRIVHGHRSRRHGPHRGAAAGRAISE